VALCALRPLPQNPNDEAYFYQLQAQSTRKLASDEYAVITETNLQKLKLTTNIFRTVLPQNKLTADFCGHIKSSFNWTHS
jgi:hypothetical protein